MSQRAAGQNELQHRNTVFVEHGSRIFARRLRGGKTGGVEHDVRRRLAKQAAQRLCRDRVFQTGNENRQGVQSLPGKPVHHGFHRFGSARLDQRAVETDRGDRCVFLPMPRSAVERADTLARIPQAGLQQRHCFRRFLAIAQQMTALEQEIAGVLRTALDEIAMQHAAAIWRQGGIFRQFFIRLVVTGQHRQLDPVCDGYGMQPFQPVGPIAFAAEYADDDKPGTGNRLLGIDIHRHRMGKLHEIGEAYGWCVLVQIACRSCKAAQFGVCGRKKNKIGGRLAEIDGLFAFIDRAFLGQQQMHRRSLLAEGGLQFRLDGSPVQPVQPNHDQARSALLTFPPVPVEIAVDSCADSLDQQAHRLAGNLDKPFQAQNVVPLNDRLEPCNDGIGVGRQTGLDHEALELVMIMLGSVLVMKLVMRFAIADIRFRRTLQPEQNIGGKRTICRTDKLHRPIDVTGYVFFDSAESCIFDKIGLVEDNHVGAIELVLEKFLQRAFMIQRLVRAPLRGNTVLIVCEATIRDRARIDDGDDTIHRYAIAYFWPVESAHERLRQGKSGCLDDDVINLAILFQQCPHRRHEVVRHGAANAAIGEFDNIVLGAGFLAATLQHFSVNSEIAEFVDDKRNSPSIRPGKQIPDQRRLASTEKPGNDRRRYFSICLMFHSFNLV